MNDFKLDDIRALITDNPNPTGDAFLDDRYDEGTKSWGHQNPYYRLFYESRIGATSIGCGQLVNPGYCS